MPELPTRSESRGASRRAVVHAAWAAPAVTVLAAAPQFAAASEGGPLRIEGLSAVYSPANPEELTVTANINGGGGTAGRMMQAASVPVTAMIDIPAGLFDSVECPEASSTSGNRGSGFTLEFDATSGTAFAATLTFGSRTTSPWDGYSGPGFGLTMNVAGEGEQDSASTGVSAFTTSVPPVLVDEFDVFGLFDDPTWDASIICGPVAVSADYPGVVGGFAVEFSILRDSEESRPPVESIPAGWVRTDGDNLNTEDTWVYRFETTQQHHTSRTNAVHDDPANPDRGPLTDDGYEFRVTLNNAGIQGASMAQLRFYLVGSSTPLVVRDFRLGGLG